MARIDATRDEADLVRYFTANAAAFGVPFRPGELTAKRPVVDPSRYLMAAVDGETAGVAGSFGFDLTLPGGAEVPVAGVSDVGVLPTHRRRGVLGALMDRLVDDAAARGEQALVLGASEAVIYGRFGFGVAAHALWGGVDTGRAALRPDAPASAGRVRLVDRHDAAPALAVAYGAAAPTRPGSLSRTAAWWDLVLGSAGIFVGGHEDHLVVVHEGADGAPDGYAIYRMEEHWGSAGPAHRLHVWELVAAETAVELDLWRFLLGHDLVAEVHGMLPPDGVLLDALADTRAAQLLAPRDQLWLRPLDLPGLLGGRSYAVDGSLVLDVVDPRRPEVAGTWDLTVGDGGGSAARTDRPADVRLPVAELGSLLLGGGSAGRLRRAGRLEEATPGAADTLDRLLRWDPLPFCTTRF